MSEPSFFMEGVVVGLILGFGMLFVIGRMNDNQAEYWRSAFCIEAENPPDFCVLDDQYRSYLDTRARVSKIWEDKTDE